MGAVLDNLMRMHCISPRQTPPACMMLVVPFWTSENSDRSWAVARHDGGVVVVPPRGRQSVSCAGSKHQPGWGQMAVTE